MSVADDLQERERTAGNAEDGLDPGQQSYDEKFNKIAKAEEDRDFDDIIADNYGPEASGEKVDAHGDTVQRNYNADSKEDRENLEDKEKNPDFSYKENNPQGNGPGGWRGKLVNAVRKNGPTGSIVGVLLFGLVGVGGGTSFIASSILVNMKEIFHSDRADATRTNQLFSRGFMANKFNNDGNKCDAKKPICRKMSYMQDSELKRYEENGFRIKGKIVGPDGKETGSRVGEVDKDGKPYPSLLTDGQSVKVEEVIYPDGTTTKSGKEFYAHADSRPNALRRAENAFNSRSAFYLNTFFSDLLKSKWNFGKGAKKFPAPDKDNNDPNNQLSDENNQDKVFNQEADAIHVDPGTSPNDPNNPLKSRGDKIVNDVSGKAAGKVAAKGGALGSIVQGTCTLYRLAYMAEAAIKAYHAYQLVRFALLFFQAADQIKDGKGDGDRVTYLANNLTWYDKSKPRSEGGGLTATDSEGYQIAAYGDQNGLKEFSKRFLLGGSIGQKIEGFTSVFENAVNPIPGISGDNGHEKMRSICRVAQSPLALVGTACAALVPALTAGGSVAPGVGNIAGFTLSAATCVCTVTGVVPFIDKIPDSIASFIPGIGDCKRLSESTEQLMNQAIELAKNSKLKDWVFNLISELNIDDNTRGVDAGNAIAAGAGMMLSVTGTGYGLKPAGSKQEVKDYVAFNQDLEDTYIALDKNDARNNPFDMDNKYSLVGSIARAMSPEKPETAEASPYGFMSTLSGVYKGALKIATGTPTADALYSQPSLLGRADKRLDNCQDKTLQNIGALGDTYCSIVGVMTGTELGKARDQAYTPGSQVINNLINYMTTDQTGDEAKGGTYCEPPNPADGNLDPKTSCGDPSKTRSIGDDGTPTPGSQYEMYLKYCTEKREAPWGLQYEYYAQGALRDQDWFSGKQCMSNSTMLMNFRMWTNYCLQSGTLNGSLNCYSAKDSKNQPTSTKGDVCSLANNPNIVYVNEGTKKGLKEICETGHSVNSCGDTNYKLNQELIDILTTLSGKYKIWLNNFGFKYDRNSCDGGQHPKGKAVDLNGIERLDGSGKAGGPDWGGITYGNVNQVKLIQDYASDWLAGINHSHGGVGQKGCSSSFNPVFPPDSVNVNGAAFFADSCDHLHIDVRDRTNLNAL